MLYNNTRYFEERGIFVAGTKDWKKRSIEEEEDINYVTTILGQSINSQVIQLTNYT